MKILIVTPLFPPDTAPSAGYTKELATRLAQENDVTLLLYGHLPEAVPGAKIISVDKRRAAASRIFAFMRRLQTTALMSDVVLIQNGPSVELPSLFTLKYTRTPVFLMESDRTALERTLANRLYHKIHLDLKKSVRAVYTKDQTWPLPRPLTHPLKPYPDKEFAHWEKSWHKHLTDLLALINK